MNEASKAEVRVFLQSMYEAQSAILTAFDLQSLWKEIADRTEAGETAKPEAIEMILASVRKESPGILQRLHAASGELQKMIDACRDTVGE